MTAKSQMFRSSWSLFSYNYNFLISSNYKEFAYNVLVQIDEQKKHYANKLLLLLKQTNLAQQGFSSHGFCPLLCPPCHPCQCEAGVVRRV